MDKKFDPINWCNKMFGETAETRENLTKLLKDKIRAEGLDEAVRILVGDGSVESVDLFHLKILRAGGFTIDRSMSVLTNFLEILTTRLRLIHTLWVWHMRLRQKCAVQKNRNIHISAETQLSAPATCIKCSSSEWAFSETTLHTTYGSPLNLVNRGKGSVNRWFSETWILPNKSVYLFSSMNCL